MKVEKGVVTLSEKELVMLLQATSKPVEIKLEAANKKLAALESMLSNPASRYYMATLNGKMFIARMRSIIKGERP